MAKAPRTVGRPRTFDERVVVDQAVSTFWKYGATNTTMRVLESELGLMPASIYNAFGSKHELLQRALASYLERMADSLLAPLEAADAGPDAVLRFIDELVEWVSDTEHPGCLMLNLLGEQSNDELMELANLHRCRMRTALQPVLARIDEGQAEARANLLVAGVMGMSVAARGGADGDEMAGFAGALRQQVDQWVSG